MYYAFDTVIYCWYGFHLSFIRFTLVTTNIQKSTMKRLPGIYKKICVCHSWVEYYVNTGVNVLCICFEK